MNRRRRKNAARKTVATREPWSAFLMPGRGKKLARRLGRREKECIDRRWEPERVWRETQLTISLPLAIALLDVLPRYWGFSESSNLLAVRADIVEAVWQGRRAPILAALNRYLDLAEAQVDELGDENNARVRGQIGLILAQARFWRQAHEAVPWLRNLLAAEQYARNMGFYALVGIIGIVLGAAQNSVLMLQAEERFEEAFDAYMAVAQRPLTKKRRGIVYLLLAQCCLEMLQDEQREALRQRLAWSLQIALVSLEGEPEQSKVIGMLLDLIEVGAQ